MDTTSLKSLLLNKSFLKKIPHFLLLICIFFLTFSLPKSFVSEKHPILFYANQCDDDIRTLFLKAIVSARHSIVLKIYSLNDPKIVEALEKQKEKGVAITILVDPKNPPLPTTLDITFKQTSALMHQKILVVDEKAVWIGSANFTTSSLRIHDNFVVAIYSKEMAKTLLESRGGTFFVQGQKIELFLLPQEKKEAFEAVLGHIQQASKSLKIAMFTWTHPRLTEAVIERSQKGLDVTLIIDENNAQGVSSKSVKSLVQYDLPLRLSTGSPMFHHKLAYIDKNILIIGSANWTKAAFSKNDECILIIHKVTSPQQKALEKLWKAMRATSISPY